MSRLKQKSVEAEAMMCPRCGNKMEKRWYSKMSFSYVCPNVSCGYVT